MVVANVSLQGSAQMVLVEDDDVVRAFPPDWPITHSTYGLCQGEHGAISTCWMPRARTHRVKSFP